MTKTRVAVLIAVHNRWRHTQDILSIITKETDLFEICIHIVDDGSTDETQANLEKSPSINYIRSDGHSYWAKSMKIAQDSVSESVDYFLWLNNDVILKNNFYRLIHQAIQGNLGCILVGRTSDPKSFDTTYGGLRRLGRHPHRFEKIKNSDSYENADTFCGNIVLIPSKINSSLRGIDDVFQHGYADYDFGLRATKSGFEIKVIPGFLGICESNSNPFLGKSRRESLKIILSVKFLPLKSQIIYSYRHGGPEWPIYVIAPYLKVIILNNHLKSKKIDIF